MTVVLPYDGSAVARAALRRLAEPAYRRWVDGRLLLVLPPAPRCIVQRRRSEARRIAGPALALRFQVTSGEPAILARRLEQSSPATFVAPVPAHGASRWYRAMAGAFLTGAVGRGVALHLGATDLARCRRAAAPSPLPSRPGVQRRWLEGRRCRVSSARSGAQEVEP